jgi:hypothetical protein
MKTSHLPLLAVILGIACDAEPTDGAAPDLDTGFRGRLVQCGDATYDFEQMNATLADHPEFAEYLGLDRVDGCEEAADWLVAASDYLESFPSEPLISRRTTFASLRPKRAT